MVRTPQCFRTECSQLDGPRTLAAAEAELCTLVLPASLIKTDYGVYPLDFSRRHKWNFTASSFRSQFIWRALPFRPKSLEGFGKVLLQATCESKFRPRSQGRKSAAPFVTAS